MPSRSDKRSGNTPHGAAPRKISTPSLPSSAPGPATTPSVSKPRRGKSVARPPKKPRPTFDVARDPITDSQSGWVYRTEGTAVPEVQSVQSVREVFSPREQPAEPSIAYQ